MADEEEDLLGLASWLSEVTSEKELQDRIIHLLNYNARQVGLVQKMLLRELPSEDAESLIRHLTWLDAQNYYMGKLQADADALLDLAEKFYLKRPGLSMPCVNDNGQPIPVTGSKSKDPFSADFTPKYHTITDTDRTVHLKAMAVPYRRLREEYRIINETIKNRMFLGNRILDEFKTRNRAAGLHTS